MQVPVVSHPKSKPAMLTPVLVRVPEPPDDVGQVEGAVLAVVVVVVVVVVGVVDVVDLVLIVLELVVVDFDVVVLVVVVVDLVVVVVVVVGPPGRLRAGSLDKDVLLCGNGRSHHCE